MTLAEFREHCLNLPGFSEDLPFGPEVLVFRVGGTPAFRGTPAVQGKIFALMDVDLFVSVNLKCDPERAIELREQYPGITPGYHMNKQHWNTVLTDGSVPHKLLLELVEHSYALVRASLPKKVREGLG